MSKVSVIIPAYNCSEYLNTAVNSIINQTHQNLEILILDDKSTDDTKKIIQSFKDNRIKRFYNEINLGYLKSCNYLLSKATGEYITFQDADDFSEKSKIEQQLLFLKTNDLKICGTNVNYLTRTGKFIGTSNFVFTSDEIKQSLLNKSYQFCPGTFLFHRSVYEKIGAYHEFWDRMGAEDYYWTWLIVEQFELKNLSDPLYNIIENPASISRNLSDNYKKLLSGDILNFLIQQRLSYKIDALHGFKLNDFESFMQKIEKPFKDDPSFLYQKLANRLFYQNRKKEALKMALKAVSKNPTSMSNYRNFIYYLRQSLFAIAIIF